MLEDVVDIEGTEEAVDADVGMSMSVMDIPLPSSTEGQVAVQLGSRSKQ